MKKVLSFLVLVLFMTSCMTTNKYSVYTTFTDFRPYIDKGFYLSIYPETPYECDYIGHIEAIVSSGGDTSLGSKKTSLAGPAKGNYHVASTEEAIEAVYNQASKAGANGVVDLKFTYAEDAYGNVISTTARGVAIKKK